MADNAKELALLRAKRYKEYEQIGTLKSSLRHHRYHGIMGKRHLLARIAAAEKAYKAILAQMTKLGESAPYSLYQKQLATRKNGIMVTVEMALDGFSFSNPAPTVPRGAHVWVRAKIEENHTGVLGIPKSHELIHVSWSYSTHYKAIDGIGPSGRDEYFVSNPLVLTREFTAPTSGTTKHNFFVYVDAYEMVL